LGLVVIARNEVRCIHRCLLSARRHVNRELPLQEVQAVRAIPIAVPVGKDFEIGDELASACDHYARPCHRSHCAQQLPAHAGPVRPIAVPGAH
jgi:hypothetical protein